MKMMEILEENFKTKLLKGIKIVFLCMRLDVFFLKIERSRFQLLLSPNYHHHCPIIIYIIAIVIFILAIKSRDSDGANKTRKFVTRRKNNSTYLLGHVLVHSQRQAGSIQWQPARGLQTHDCDGITAILWDDGIIGFVTTHSDLKGKNKNTN